MKHVSLLPTTRSGRPSYRLVGPDGRRIEAFEVFANYMTRHPHATVESYCSWLARFIDYFIEATSNLATTDTEALPRQTLVDIIKAYEEYLVYGGDSDDPIARQVSEASPSPRISMRSADQMCAPVRIYLQLSERVREQIQELVAHGLSSDAVDPVPMFRGVQVEPTLYQRRALLARSMLAGVLADGPKYLAEGILPSRGADVIQQVQDGDAFPFDLACSLFDEFPTWRDRALYSFYAASGCRGSEGRQVLWEDVDISNRRVRLVAPHLRANHPSYLSLTPSQRRKNLVWKGRNTAVTFLIEPFAAYFFDALENYVKHEYIAHGAHEFVFQNIETMRRPGTPFLLTARSTRSADFQRSLAALGRKVDDPRVSEKAAHSLRHMYGFYLVNYCPRADGGYGLPLALVKIIMGHQLISSTEQYARQDRDLVEADLSYANRKMLYGDLYQRTLVETKRDILMSRLAEMNAQLAAERAVSKQLAP